MLDFGIHRAIGGDHDLQNPGDMLCAALAACLDSTLRMIAVRMGIALKTLAVEVRAFADVRGCLVVDRQVPVGFQRIDVDVLIEAEGNTDPAQISRLTSVAERCCVVLQTLRGDIAVDTRFRGPGSHCIR
ncbi:OsmC family protein [Bradyrhizobium sp. AZCC 1610]|uniref:OsmC family protein n=1 Tax=Bradyrhizobium sp. AZCC 1610 TaxID=3117020 RepID=UPI002FEFAFE8